MDIVKMLDEHLISSNPPSKERSYFHISELGKSKKEIFDSMKNPKERKTDALLQRIFDNGNFVHDRFYKYFAEMGILIAAEINVGDELFHGRIDAIVSDKKDLWLVDIKSCSYWVFNQLTDAKHEDKIQLQFYMYYLNIPRGMLLYEDKNHQTIKVFKYELNRPMVEAMIEEFKKFKEEIDKGVTTFEAKPITVDDLYYG